MAPTSRLLAAAALTATFAAAPTNASEACWIGHAANSVADTATGLWRGALELGEDALDWAGDTISRTYAALSAYPQGLRVYADAAWTPAESHDEPLPERVVLLIHGLDEPGAIWNDLAPALASDGHAVVRFDYPNDQAIADSARLLLESLDALHELGARDVVIVAHSMGGLVARDALTRANAPADIQVEHLITIGTPNQGAPLASLRWVAETREFFATIFVPAHRPRAPLAFIEDGNGAAGRDLKPGSVFLETLNARPLPGDLAMTIIAGAWFDPEQDALAQSLISAARWIPCSERLFPDAGIERFAARIDSAAQTLGDGVVPLDSTRIEGVDDYVVLAGDHRALLRSEDAPAIDVILDRLGSGDR